MSTLVISEPEICLLTCQLLIVSQEDEKTIISSLDSHNYCPAYNFYTSQTDKILTKIDDYVEETLAKEVYENVYTKVEAFFRTIIEDGTFKEIVRCTENLFKSECKQKMTKSELLTYRSQIRIYSSRERNLIFSFNTDDFKKFFTNEVCSILNFIERYKADNVHFAFPKDIIPVRKCFHIDIANTDEKQLDADLEDLYQRIVIIYSTIFSSKFSNSGYRIGVFNELKFIKSCLHYVTFDMDRRLMRVKKYMRHFRTQYFKRQIGVGTSKRLEDLLELPPYRFESLEKELSMVFENLKV